MDSLPRLLYKYLPPKRVDVLEQRRIRFTPLSSFNDPFEGRPSITTLAPEHELREMLRDLLPAEIRRGYEWLPQEAREHLTLEMFEDLAASIAQVEEAELFAALSGLKQDVQDFLYSKFDQLVGVLALSEVPDSLLMWSHYAASHTGLVVGVDPRHPYFDQRKSEKDELRHLRRVVYREARPRGAMTAMDGTDLFFVKSGHWAYEREWRMLQPLESATQIVTDESMAIHLFEFPSAVVREVIIGARAAETTRNRVLGCIQNGGLHEDVQVTQAYPDDNHFLLRFKNVSLKPDGAAQN